jgi:hypothetical protein
MTEKKAKRREITTVRFLKLTKQAVKDLELNPEDSVEVYIEALRDKALDELGA